MAAKKPKKNSASKKTTSGANKPAKRLAKKSIPKPNTKSIGVAQLPLAPGVSVQPVQLQDEMERSFLDYAMSVIMSRALPDVRDGLKPVHRRIIWDMHQQGFRPDRPFVKCARVTGDTMARYHPHGDGAIYDALVRMAQPFSLRHPLIDFHGNYGSPDFGPAASRYTESRLHPLAMQLLADIDEDTVDLIANYDGTSEEPSVLPSRFPNLLVNGSQGIAVGMATSIPPHNLGEVVDATLHLINHPDASIADLMKFVKGPDFPTGGLILGRSGINDAYKTGRGSIKMRAKVAIEEGQRNQMRIVVTEHARDRGFHRRNQRDGQAERRKRPDFESGLNEDAQRCHSRTGHGQRHGPFDGRHQPSQLRHCRSSNAKHRSNEGHRPSHQ